MINVLYLFLYATIIVNVHAEVQPENNDAPNNLSLLDVYASQNSQVSSGWSVPAKGFSWHENGHVARATNKVSAFFSKYVQLDDIAMGKVQLANNVLISANSMPGSIFVKEASVEPNAPIYAVPQPVSAPRVTMTAQMDSMTAAFDVTYLRQTGWALITDMDDTLRDADVLDKVQLVRKAALPPVAIKGMPELLQHLSQITNGDLPTFYVSQSPAQFYPKKFKSFVNKELLPGEFFLSNLTASEWVDTSINADALIEYKTEAINAIQYRFPHRQFIMLGDSGQSDPETYGDAYRNFGPDVVKCIYIRLVEGQNVQKEAEKNTEARFLQAFKNIPAQSWYVFRDPSELMGITAAQIQQNMCRPQI